MRKIIRTLRRYRIASAFLGLSLISVAVAVEILPVPSAVYLPNPYSIQVWRSYGLAAVRVDVLLQRPDQFEITIRLETLPPKKADAYGMGELRLPSDVMVISCHPTQSLGVRVIYPRVNDPGCIRPTRDPESDGPDLEFVMTHFRPDPQENNSYWFDSVTVTVSASRFAFDSNGQETEAVLPALQADSLYPPQQKLAPTMGVRYEVPGASGYDWPLSVDGTGQDERQINSNSIQWTESAPQAANVISIDASDKAAQENGQLFLFITGACVGFAGGALLAAFQAIPQSSENRGQDQKPPETRDQDQRHTMSRSREHRGQSTQLLQPPERQPESTASGEVYLHFGNARATVNHIKEAITWLEATKGSNSPFTQAMDSYKNPLADWARGNRYQGLKTWKGSRIPSKPQVADYLLRRLAAIQDAENLGSRSGLPREISRCIYGRIHTGYCTTQRGSHRGGQSSHRCACSAPGDSLSP